jgi:hypothetical protein
MFPHGCQSAFEALDAHTLPNGYFIHKKGSKGADMKDFV